MTLSSSLAPVSIASLPLTPMGCDLRTFQYMPLDVAALKKSRSWLYAKRRPELGFYIFNLIMKAWNGVPAASLPNDPAQLAEMAMCDITQWDRVEESVLFGWVLCADNRLYLPWLAERACKAWDGRHRHLNRLPRTYEISNSEWSVMRLAVFARDNYTCIYCGAHGVPLDVDHLTPYSKGGFSTMKNLGTACTSCNRSKGNKTEEEYRHALR